MKKIIIAAIVCAMAVTAGFAAEAEEYNNGFEPSCEYGDIYPMGFRVVDVERDENDVDLVTVETGSGVLFQFTAYGSDWCVGDGAAAIMGNNGTPDSIYDDIILSVRYTAW